MKLCSFLPFLLLCSCNNAFVYRTAKGSELGYTGSFAAKSSKERTEIHLANGATIVKELENKDEVESIKTFGRLALGKAGIESATKATSEVTSAIKN